MKIKRIREFDWWDYKYAKSPTEHKVYSKQYEVASFQLHKGDYRLGSHADDDIVEIWCFHVEDKHRGKNTGSMIIQRLQKKHDKIWLSCNLGNVRAQKFYERLGFKKAKICSHVIEYLYTK